MADGRWVTMNGHHVFIPAGGAGEDRVAHARGIVATVAKTTAKLVGSAVGSVYRNTVGAYVANYAADIAAEKRLRNEVNQPARRALSRAEVMAIVDKRRSR